MQAVWNWPQRRLTRRLTRRSEAALKFYLQKFAEIQQMIFETLHLQCAKDLRQFIG